MSLTSFVVKVFFFNFELKLQIFVMTKAVSNTDICFIKTVILWWEQMRKCVLKTGFLLVLVQNWTKLFFQQLESRIWPYETMCSMVLILGGNSKHSAHATNINLKIALRRSNYRFHSTRAHLFLSYHLIYVLWCETSAPILDPN